MIIFKEAFGLGLEKLFGHTQSSRPRLEDFEDLKIARDLKILLRGAASPVKRQQKKRENRPVVFHHLSGTLLTSSRGGTRGKGIGAHKPSQKKTPIAHFREYS